MSSNPLTRRDLLRLGLAAGAASSLGLPAAFAEQASKPAQTPTPATPNYLDIAARAARWIHTARVETPQGVLWLTGPERPATGDKAYREEAAAGADYLIATLPTQADPKNGDTGLYVGVGGVGFTLHRVFKETGDEKYRKAAVRCRDLIHTAAQPAGAGVEWGGVTDIIAGVSGTGLYLLDVAKTMDDTASRDLAVRAGLRLIELGIPEAGGRKWRMDPEFKRLMPNFSHGTAGVAYYLATLHHETGRQEFLDAALAGARYLQSIATTEGDTCLIFHDELDNKNLYYLGWCHGPVGTSRLWIRLNWIGPKTSAYAQTEYMQGDGGWNVDATDVCACEAARMGVKLPGSPII